MPYPESCPECGGAFRNTGTHYTARRNEVGRHVLLELGCQNTSRRYWWDFTSGMAAEDGATPGHPAVAASAQANAAIDGDSNGHAGLATLDLPTAPVFNGHHMEEPANPTPPLEHTFENEPSSTPRVGLEKTPEAPDTLKEAFVRQLQLDRLTLRQMRSWLMADEARRAMEVAAGATEATYERLALILFGVDLQQLLGKQPAPPPNPGLSAEERLELQREKARIRARLRRAAAKAARQT
jgi:hypothetical protein